MNYSISDISEKLNARVEEVCRMLLPGGKVSSGHWECASVDGDKGKSFKVNLNGGYPGKWRDWATSEDRGDLVDLWQICRGLTKVETLRECKEFLGITDDLYSPKKEYAKPLVNDKIKPISPQGKVMQYMTQERKLDSAIVNRFKLEGDKENIIYPYYDNEGTLLNRMYVSFKRDSNGKKKIYQEKGCAPCLWGWHALPDDVWDKREILICEGQIDCMTWTQWGINALSMPSGSNLSWINYEWEKLEAFSTIYISMDNDAAGNEHVKNIVSRLGVHRCRIVKMPFKDANEALKKGVSDSDPMLWIMDSEYPSMDGMVSCYHYLDKTIEEFYPSPYTPKGLHIPLLCRNDGGIRIDPGEVTAWMGVSFHGKSTFLGWIMAVCASGEKPCMIASMEMKPQKILSRICKAMANKSNLSKEEIGHCFEAISNTLFFVDKLGYISPEELLEMMNFAYSRYGCGQFLIDSLMRISGLEEDNVAQGKFMNSLAEFSKRTNTHIHLVCHPKKTPVEGNLTKMDIKGSSLITNNVDNIVIIKKNMAKENLRKERTLTPAEELGMHDTEIISEKQRESGWVGKILLKFNSDIFTYSAFNDKQFIK